MEVFIGDSNSINIAEIITKMNDYLTDNFGDDMPLVEYRSVGYYSIVYFLGSVMWSSENDDRIWIEAKGDYEPLDAYIKKQCNELISYIKKVDFK